MKRHILLTALLSLFSLFSFAQYDPGNVTVGMNGAQTVDPTGQTSFSFNTTSLPNNFFRNGPNQEFGYFTNDKYFTIIPQNDYSLTISNNNQMDTHIWLFTYSNGINMITHGDGDNGITATLTAYQRYYVVVEGLYSNGQINTNFSFSITGDNRNTAINAGNYSQSFEYSSSLNSDFYSNKYNGRSTKDIFYKFTLSSNMTVTMTHEGSTVTDTYMYLLDSSGNLITSNDDYSGEGHCTSTYNSYIKQYLTAGTYYVVSEGYSTNGFIKTNIKGVCGDTKNSAIKTGTYSTNFSYTNTVNTSSDYSNQYTGRSTSDVFYELKLNSTLIVTINHQSSSLSDTYLHLLNSSGELIVSNDDYSGYDHCTNTRHSYIRRKLTPGTYYIVSEGYSSNGGITTHISGVTEPSGNTMSNAIVAGTYSTAFNYNNTANLHSFTNDYTGRSTNDVFHKFVLTAPMNVTITHEGSTLSDTYMTLLNSSGSVITSNNDYSGEGHCVNTKHSFIQKQLSAGTYYVVSEGYSAEDYVRLNITGSTANGYDYPVIPSSYSTDSRGVGALGGTFDISPLGGATYTIPIEAPAGVHGMQPHISIVYNSQSGNGVVGYGTNIAGLSSITRGPKNIAQDGTARGIKNGADDAFYLDGARLILASGTPGQEGAIYHLESDPFTTVTLHGTYYESINYMWFEVVNKEGVKVYYGYSSGRHTYTVGEKQKTKSWYVDYMEDPFGNTMVINYETDNNVLYPKSIRYGMSNQSYNPLENYIVFDYLYSSRNDYVETKYDGITCRMNKLLTKITTKTGSNVYRTYDFNYNTTGDGSSKKYSRLTSVTKKNGNGESLPPIEFTWSYIPTTNYTSRTLNTVNNVSSPAIAINDQKFGSADLNGDGIDDLIGYGTNKDSQQRNHLYVYKYLSTKKENGSVVFTLDNEQNLLLSYQLLSGNMYSADFIDFVRSNNVGNTSIVDFDGDGNNEYMFASTFTWLEHDFWHFQDVLRNHIEFTMVKGDNTRYGTGAVYYTNEKPLYATGDINNDGKSDIVIVEKGLVEDSYGWRKIHVLSESVDPSDYVYDEEDVNHLNPISPSLDFEVYMPNTPMHFFISDMNNDGLQDLFVIHSTGYYIYYNQGGPISKSNMMFTTATGCYSTGSNLKSAYMVTSGDFNGDGMMDILSNGVNDSNWKFFINNGNGGFQEYTACSLPNITKHNYTNNDSERFECNVMDFDGDGRDDVILTKAKYNSNGSYDKTHTYWMRSNGTYLSQVYYATSNVENDALCSRILTGDFDGDGRIELFNYGNDLAQGSNANGSAIYRYYDNSGFSNQTGKITKIVGDYGASIEITYSTLADNNVYSKGANASYPAPYVCFPLNVVKSITCNNGVAGNSSKTLSYEGLRIQKTGRGILGYKKRIAIDNISGQRVESGVSAWDPTFYVPTSSYSIVTEGGVASQKTTAIGYQLINDSMYYPISTTVTEVDFDGNTIITTNEFSASNGMPVRETVNYGTNMYKIIEYSNYLTRGRRLQPEYMTIKSRYPGDPEFSTTTKYSYNSSTGALETQIENFNKAMPLTTTYTYTSHGNVWSKSISGQGIGSYVQYYSYDDTKRFVTREYSSPAAFVYDFTYDMWGNKLTETDNTNTSSPITNSYEYDTWGNIIACTMADGSTQKFVRGWSNDASKRYFILAEGDGRAWTKTWYDNAGREVLTESVGLKDVSIRKTIGYNNKGQVISVTNTEGDNTITQNYTYDSRGRIIHETSTSGASIGYQYGNRTVIITSNNQETYRLYDALDNLVEVTDPKGATVDYIYSSNGKLLRAETDGHVYSYTYDAMGNKISSSDPDAGVTTYTYDALGREVTRTDARNVHFTNTYDYLGRITRRSADDMVINYWYGASGNNKFRLVTEIMDSWENNYEYDEIGRIIAEERGGHRTEYEYSDKGQLVKKTWADTGLPQRQVNYSYDSYGNVIGINAISGTIQWNQTGFTGKNSTSTMKLHSNSTVFSKSITIGNDGYLSNETLSRGGTTLRNTNYNYNGVTGNLSDRTNNGVIETFSYDEADRLTGMTKTGLQIMSVSYDNYGNIISKTGIGNYYYNENNKPHAVTSVDNTSNLIPNGNQTITYNAWGKVSEINATVDNNTYKYEIIYGPDLQRVLAVLWKNNELLHLVNYGNEYEEKYLNGEITRYYYVTGADGCTAVYTSHTMTGDKAYCVDQDQIGNILALYDQYGTKCFGAEYDPWGRRTVMSGSIEYDRGFTGHEHIDEIGLIDMNGRMYDPMLGRFISVDPFIQMPDNPQNYNRYSYCLNNPMKYKDPSGEIAEWLVPVLIGAGVFGTGNLVTHAIRGDVHDLSDGAYYFFQGALAGAALGLTWYFAPCLPLGNYLQAYMTLAAQFKVGMTIASAAISLIKGATGDWTGPIVAAELLLGNFYIDENLRHEPGGFWRGVWQGYLRHTWESIQTELGHATNQFLNMIWLVDRVDYMGGATFATHEHADGTGGCSLGSYKWVRIEDAIEGSFEDRVKSDPLFMHEYGHSFDSRYFGPLYLIEGLLSAGSALFSIDAPHKPRGVTTHASFFTEIRANRMAKEYFAKYYDVDWNSPYEKFKDDPYQQGHTIETFYPTVK